MFFFSKCFFYLLRINTLCCIAFCYLLLLTLSSCLNITKADAPDFGFSENISLEFSYYCENGLPAAGITDTGFAEQCIFCDFGYKLDINNVCFPLPDDPDSDSVSGTDDIDGDNDGLIDIRDITMLYNMRYNLAGTSYITSSGVNPTNGNVLGAPTSPTENCPRVGVNGTYLCGYEMVNDLTFDPNGDGTWSSDASGTLTIDDPLTGTDIVLPSNFVGWVPIGTPDLPFNAIFEGNGNIISDLVIGSSNMMYQNLGFFDTISFTSIIRNVYLEDVLINLNIMSADDARLGGLVAVQNAGLIAGCSISNGSQIRNNSGTAVMGGLVGQMATINSYILASDAVAISLIGGSGAETIGGLVGETLAGQIVSSFIFNTTITPNQGANITGGLVGRVVTGTIFATYTNVTIDADSTDNVRDNIGGLLGELVTGSVIASYAVSSLETTSMTTNDYLGGLIGLSTVSTVGSISISMSYAVPSFTSGTIGSIIADHQNISNTGTATAVVVFATSYGFQTRLDTFSVLSPTQITTDHAVNATRGLLTIEFLTRANSSTASSTTWSENIWDFDHSSDRPVLRYAELENIVTCLDYNFILLRQPESTDTTQRIREEIVCNTSLLPNQ